MLFLSLIDILLIAYVLWHWKFKRSDDALSGGEPFPAVSVMICLILLGLLLWFQIQHSRLERRLTVVATELAGKPAQVNCETFLESWMPENIQFEGYVPNGSSRLFLRHGVCRRLTEVIASPDPTSRFHSTAAVILAHEAMHVRGLTNEAQTECAAIQRAARTARLLGVGDEVALELARTY